MAITQDCGPSLGIPGGGELLIERPSSLSSLMHKSAHYRVVLHSEHPAIPAGMIAQPTVTGKHTAFGMPAGRGASHVSPWGGS